MSFPYTETPDYTVEVEAIHGTGKVMLSFIGPGSSYAVSLGLDTLSDLIAALRDQLATAIEFSVPQSAAADTGYSDTMPVFGGEFPINVVSVVAL